MLSNKPLGIAGAAMLGTVVLLGTNAANAVINLDASAADKANAVATYAKETLVTAVDGEDGMTYYMVDGAADTLEVQGMVGVGGTSGSVLILEYVLDGMVFTETSATELTLGLDNCSAGNTATRRGGGTKGVNKVSFIFTRTGGTTTAETLACLAIDNIAVSADMAGSVTMNVSDNLPLPATHTESYPGAVRVAAALKETATMNMPIATVASKFLSFSDGAGGTMQEATVGSFMVGMEMMRLAADDAGAVEARDLYAAGTNEANGGSDGVDATAESSVTIMGDFAFAHMVTLDDTATCDDAGTDLRMDPVTVGDDMVRDTTRLQAQTVEYVNNQPHLCITVLAADHDDAVAISETGPYMVTTRYVGGTEDAKFPAPGMTRELGYIDRDGTTVRLPYLTTNMRFNQRIYIVNRGSEAKYVMTFHGEGDMAGMDAEGLLMGGGATKILSIGDDDVVTIGPGRTSTSGTIVIEAQPKNDRCSHLPDQPGARHQRHGGVSGRLAGKDWPGCTGSRDSEKKGFGPSFPFGRSNFHWARCPDRAPFTNSRHVAAGRRRWPGRHRSSPAGDGATCPPGCCRRTSPARTSSPAEKGPPR